MLYNLLTPAIKSSSVNWASLILRVGMGVLMIPHGYGKLERFEGLSTRFMDFMGLGSSTSLILAIFAELVCSILLVLGFCTRAIIIPLIITMITAAFVAHADDPLSDKEHSLMYLTAYLAIFILGTGKYSIDALLFKKRAY
ncbi:DoxX family protein [Marinoscillum sp.]|uniref:DoxX family protein n=1 Tax=Marinoscillum sp. TaxID=2024838 RepID=UPI003BACF3CD